MHVEAALEPFCEIGADLVCSYLRVIHFQFELF